MTATSSPGATVSWTAWWKPVLGSMLRIWNQPKSESGNGLPSISLDPRVPVAGVAVRGWHYSSCTTIV